MITLAKLKSEFTSILTSQKVSARMSDWAYWVATDIISSYDFWWNKKKGSFTTTASTAEYFLSSRVNMKQILYMGDENNRAKEIIEVPLEEIYRYDSTPTETGEPIHWAYVEQSEVQAATTAAATLSVVSSSTSDLAIKLVARVKVNGIERVEEISINGTTSVSGTLSVDADGIESLSLASECQGVVTITSGATTVATIPPGQLRVQCPRIRLWRVPSSSLTIPYVFYQRVMKPVKDGDIIDLPDAAMKALRRGIAVIGHEDNGDMDYMQLADQQYEAYKRELYSWSTRELNKVYKKNFGRKKSGEVPFTMPRPTAWTIT